MTVFSLHPLHAISGLPSKKIDVLKSSKHYCSRWQKKKPKKDQIYLLFILFLSVSYFFMLVSSNANSFCTDNMRVCTCAVVAFISAEEWFPPDTRNRIIRHLLINEIYSLHVITPFYILTSHTSVEYNVPFKFQSSFSSFHKLCFKRNNNRPPKDSQVSV